MKLYFVSQNWVTSILKCILLSALPVYIELLCSVAQKKKKEKFYALLWFLKIYTVHI